MSLFNISYDLDVCHCSSHATNHLIPSSRLRRETLAGAHSSPSAQLWALTEFFLEGCSSGACGWSGWNNVGLKACTNIQKRRSAGEKAWLQSCYRQKLTHLMDPSRPHGTYREHELERHCGAVYTLASLDNATMRSPTEAHTWWSVLNYVGALLTTQDPSTIVRHIIVHLLCNGAPRMS